MRKLIILAIFVPSLLFAAWDNTKPADNRVWNLAASDIRANWDALEDVLGLDLDGGVKSVTGPTYGAKGDGTTDDTAAVQAAITASAGGICYFPSGKTFRITSSVTIPSNTIIVGYGAKILRDYSAGDVANGSFRNSDQAAGNVNIEIHGLKFQSNETSDIGVHIGLALVDGVVINDVEVISCYQGWSFSLSVDNARISNCKILCPERPGGPDTGDGLHVWGGSDIAITNCVISSDDDCIAIGSELGARDITNVAVSNCVTRPLASTGFKMYTAATHSREQIIDGVVVSNLTIDHSRSASATGKSIYIYDNRSEAGFSSAAQIKNVKIENVYIDATRGAGSAIFVDAVPSDVATGAITNHRIQNISFSNITVVAPQTQYLEAWGVVDMDIINLRGFGERTAARGVTLSSCHNVSVVGGIIKDAGNHAIRFDDGAANWEDCTNISVTGLTIIDPTTFCIAPGEVDGLTVVGCTLEGGTFGIVEEAVTLNSCYAGNVFTGQSTAAIANINELTVMAGNVGATNSTGLISTTSSVNLASGAGTEITLYTVPTGMTLMPTKVILRDFSAADHATPPIITLGTGGTTADDFLGDQTLTNLTANFARENIILQPLPNATPVTTDSIPAAGTFVLEITQANGAALTCTAELYGRLY